MDPITRALLTRLARFSMRDRPPAAGVQVATGTGHVLELLRVASIMLACSFATVWPAALDVAPDASWPVYLAAAGILVPGLWAGVRMTVWFLDDRSGVFVEPTELVVWTKRGPHRFSRAAATFTLRSLGPLVWPVVHDATGRSARLSGLLTLRSPGEQLTVRTAQTGAVGWKGTGARFDGDLEVLAAVIADAERLEATSPELATGAGQAWQARRKA